MRLIKWFKYQIYKIKMDFAFKKKVKDLRKRDPFIYK